MNARQAFFILNIILLALGIVGVAFVFRSHSASTQQHNDAAKLRIVATIYPLGDFARQIGGDFVDVQTIVPAGVEPHEYEPTPHDIAAMYAADIVLIDGSGIDSWTTKIQEDLRTQQIEVLVLHRDDGGVSESHAWLNPKRVQEDVDRIKDSLIRKDIVHTGRYESSAGMYQNRLNTMNLAYERGLSLCRIRTVVVSHDAFGSLARAYDFETFSIAGFSPESEPSSRQLADLATFMRERRLKYVFFETLTSPRLAETLANEVGANVLTLNPLEGLTDEQLREGKEYVSIMYENLDNLKQGMECYE